MRTRSADVHVADTSQGLEVQSWRQVRSEAPMSGQAQENQTASLGSSCVRLRLIQEEGKSRDR